MHELKVNNSIICSYLSVSDMLISLANVKIKLISLSTDEFVVASLLNSNTMIRLSHVIAVNRLQLELNVTNVARYNKADFGP